jgi:hypothetical protein
MHTLLAFFLILTQSFTASTNFSFDLDGPVDTRPGTWGTAEASAKFITFAPPAGYRVRILRASGDLVAWPQVLDGVPVKPGRYAGVLLGLSTTAQEGSVRGDWLADNCFLYVQAGLDATPVRAAFDRKTDALLEPDHKLALKVASWLNTTERKIHIEPTLTIVYRFEKGL